MMATNPHKNNSARTVTGGNSKKPIELSEQFVFTHCRQDESCNGEAGFQMRLRSCDDVGMQEFTARLSYEPPDTQMQDPAGAPHRLAWLRFAKDGRDTHCVLAHSRYLGRDTESRWGNFYTRTIFYTKRPPLKQVLQYCDSPLWNDTDFGNKGIEFSPRFPGFPEKGQQIGDQQLQAFLSNEQFPDRVGKLAPNQRQRLLAWTATSYLKALNSERFRHVYIHGEPSLVAMLLYGVATILPDSLLRQLTFTTYEKPGQQLRSFSSALVIGTLTDHPKEGLHDSFLAQQGLVIDTFTQMCSPEVQTPLFVHLDDYVFLAAKGEFAKLKELHSLFSRAENITTGTLDEAWQVHSDQELLASNASALPDCDIVAALRRLQNLALGDKLLKEEFSEDQSSYVVLRKQRRDQLWGLLRTQCIRDDALLTEFVGILTQPDALLQHLSEIVMLICDQNILWKNSWRLYRAMRKSEAATVLIQLLVEVHKRLGASGPETLDFPARIDLLRECQRQFPGKGSLDSQLTWLLQLQDPECIWDLSTIEPPFPPTWVGQALAVSIGEQTAKEISQLLLNSAGEGDADISLWNGFKATFKEAPLKLRKANLEFLFKAQPSEVVGFFFLTSQRLSLQLEELNRSFLIPLLEDYSVQLYKSPRGIFGWMHHWNDIGNLAAIRSYLGNDLVSEKIVLTALESIGLGLLLGRPEQVKNLKEIDGWVRNNKVSLNENVRQKLEEIKEKQRKLTKRHVPKGVLVCICLCVGFAIGLVVYWLSERFGPVALEYLSRLWNYLSSFWRGGA